MKNDNLLLKTVYANEENLLEQVKSQLQAGADPNERTEYFETPLRVSSRLGRFEVVKLLFDSGADPSHLNWTPLFPCRCLWQFAAGARLRGRRRRLKCQGYMGAHPLYFLLYKAVI